MNRSKTIKVVLRLSIILILLACAVAVSTAADLLGSGDLTRGWVNAHTGQQQEITQLVNSGSTGIT